MSRRRENLHAGNRPEGLRWSVVRADQVPVVYFRIALMTGSADDPEGKEGLASFTASLMRRGTVSYSRQEIDDALDFIAADLWVNCQKDMTVFGGRTLTENLDRFYAIFSEVLLHPSFSEEEIEKMKTDQIDEIEEIRQRDEALVRESFNIFIYAGHPYGHPDAGRISSVKRFTRQDVLGFYHSHFRQGNLLIGLAGNIPGELMKRIEVDFSSLPKGDSSCRRSIAKIPQRKKVLIIEKEGRTQAQLRIGHPIGITRKDQDYFPLLVANNYLGKHRVSIGKLYNEVREKRGLSYGAYSYIEHFLGVSGPVKLPVPNLARREQYFSIWVYPKIENAKFVIKLAMRELSNLVAAGIDARQLEEQKNFTVNNFPFEVETPDRKLAMMLDDVLYGCKDFAGMFETGIRKVSTSALRSATEKYLFPDRVAIAAVVSDGEAFINEMLSHDTAVEYPSGVDPHAFVREDSAIKNFDLGLHGDDFLIVRASDLFQ